MGKRGSTLGQAGRREGDFAPPPSSACQKTAIFVSRQVFPVDANLLSLRSWNKSFLRLTYQSQLWPRRIEWSNLAKLFPPGGRLPHQTKHKFLRGQSWCLLLARGRELSSSPFHEDTAPTGEQHFLQLFALLSLLLPPLPPSQAAYPHLPSLHSPSFLFLLRSESLLAESAVLPFPLRSWSG